VFGENPDMLMNDEWLRCAGVVTCPSFIVVFCLGRMARESKRSRPAADRISRSASNFSPECFTFASLKARPPFISTAEWSWQESDVIFVKYPNESWKRKKWRWKRNQGECQRGVSDLALLVLTGHSLNRWPLCYWHAVNSQCIIDRTWHSPPEHQRNSGKRIATWTGENPGGPSPEPLAWQIDERRINRNKYKH